MTLRDRLMRWRAPVFGTATWAGIILAASVLVVLIFLRILPSDPPDEANDFNASYLPVARSLVAGEGLTFAGRAATRYPPGFPIILAGVLRAAGAFGLREGVALTAFNTLCLGVIPVLLFAIARRVWGDLGALIPAMLWLSYPCALWLARQPTSEAPFIVLTYGGVLAFIHALGCGSRVRWLLFASGLLLGMAMLIRPAGIGVGFVLAALLARLRPDLPRRTRLGLAGVLLFGNLVAILPWEISLYRARGRIIPLSEGSVPSIHDGLTFAARPRGAGSPAAVPDEVRGVMQTLLESTRDDQTLLDLAEALGRQFRDHPRIVLELVLLKLARSWYGTDSMRLDYTILAIQLVYLPLILIASRAAWRLGGRPRQAVLMVWSVAAYSWGMATLVLSTVRYMLPAIGLLFVLVPALLSRRLTGASGTLPWSSPDVAG